MIATDRIRLAQLKRQLISDSLARKAMLESLITLIRKDEREKVLGITERARQSER